jgi:hypothetical protein
MNTNKKIILGDDTIVYLSKPNENMKKTHNERGAGRKKKYYVPVKLIRVPLPILDEVDLLSKPYLRTEEKE